MTALEIHTRHLPTPTTADRAPDRPDNRTYTGQLLPPARPGTTGRIRHTHYLHLPGRRATLDGPFPEVAQILQLLRARGDLTDASTPTPSPRGVMVTIQFPATPLRPGATRSSRPARRWSLRRRITITTAVLATTTAILAAAGYLLVATLPTPAAATVPLACLLLTMATRAGRRVCKTAVTVIHRH